MTETIQDKLGNDREIYAKFSYDYRNRLIVDVQLRSVDKATLIAAALNENLMVTVSHSETIVISPAAFEYDEETGESTLIEAEVTETTELPDTYESARHVSISHLGNVVLVPAVIVDEEVITPAVLSEFHHANIRLQLSVLDRVDAEGYPLWMLTILKWMEYGLDTVDDKGILGKELGGIELLEGIKSSARVWAGS